MIFVYAQWERFCRELSRSDRKSIPACRVLQEKSAGPYLILKHDVETAVSHAHAMANIEHKHGHSGSYYVQAYLLEDEENVRLLQEMQQMGHEVSYHYDVLDSSRGDMEKARAEFEKNLSLFRSHGFPCATVCQHGNPVAERIGYHSNRDFFRNSRAQELYPELADIMVDFKAKTETEYRYFSDAGRKFHLIFDPINNDIEHSDDQNTPCEDLDGVLALIPAGESAIVSVHPHRWTSSAAAYRGKALLFRVIRTTARVLVKIPVLKKILARYYYLARKI